MLQVQENSQIPWHQVKIFVRKSDEFAKLHDVVESEVQQYNIEGKLLYYVVELVSMLQKVYVLREKGPAQQK